MALASRVDYTVFVADNGTASSGASGSYTFPSGAKVYVPVYYQNGGSAEAAPESLISLTASSGLSLTAVANLLISNGNTDYCSVIKVFEAIGDGVATTLTASKTGQGGNWRLLPMSYASGYNASPNGVYVAAVAGVNDGAYSPALSGAPDTNSEVVALLMGSLNSGAPTITVGTGWTEFYDNGLSDYYRVQAQYRRSSTSSTVTWDDVIVGGGGYYHNPVAVAFEVKAAAGGGGSNAAQRRRRQRIFGTGPY